MIVYDLRCPKGHVFEGWFRDSGAYETQKDAGEVTCPACGSHRVSKAPMAPRISTGAAEPDARRDAATDKDAPRETFAAMAPQGSRQAEVVAAAMKVLRELHKEVESSCENVGERFAEEARKIHYGEAEKRGIYGEATPDEAKELRDEGVDFQPLPRLPRENA